MRHNILPPYVMLAIMFNWKALQVTKNERGLGSPLVPPVANGKHAVMLKPCALKRHDATLYPIGNPQAA